MGHLTHGWDNKTQVAAHEPDSSFPKELGWTSPPRKRRWEGNGQLSAGAGSTPSCLKWGFAAGVQMKSRPVSSRDLQQQILKQV